MFFNTQLSYPRMIIKSLLWILRLSQIFHIFIFCETATVIVKIKTPEKKLFLGSVHTHWIKKVINRIFLFLFFFSVAFVFFPFYIHAMRYNLFSVTFTNVTKKKKLHRFHNHE